ncbi:MAG: J domain-containing protein [Deltaproteobacteria bacterium]|nr:J domain-containing protein [Deltaproteobacteria bacterium]
MTIRDCYIILGVSSRTSMEEVRRRYRALARECHPDHHPDDPEAVKQFRRLAEAYETIQQSRSRSRAASDNLHRPRFSEDHEVFEEFFGIGGDATRFRRSAGADFRYDLQISLAAAVRGTQTVIQVERTVNCRPCQGTGLAPGGAYVPCPQCQGRGRRYGGPGLLRFGPVCQRCRGRGKIAAQNCSHCQGQGSTRGKREYRLHIPPGTEDGARLRFDGQGGDGFDYGPPGNLEVVIHVAPDEFFTRKGNDIYCQVKVSFAEAFRGDYVLVPTLDGYRTVRLPQGTRNGVVFRIPGAGVPGGPGLPDGDQMLEIVVTAPNDFSPKRKELLEEVAHLGSAASSRAGT